jgi:plastocyanin
MKTAFAFSAVAVLGAAVVSVGLAAPPRQAHITIRHQTSHCHAWALNGGKYAAHLDAKVAVGGTITVTNNDVMPHRWLEKSGPNAVLSGSPSMSHIGAKLKVTFPRAGTYIFTTKAGEDYMKGVKTTGEDNVLTLKVVVR